MAAAAQELAPLDDGVDHVRGRPGSPVVLLYGDFQCPFSRKAHLAIARVEQRLDGAVRYAFRHFPLTELHPRALAAAGAAEAAAAQGRFWELADVLFTRQRELAEEDLRRHAAATGLDLAAFDRDRVGDAACARIARDVASGIASGQVHGTPTLFLDGVVHRGPYGARDLLDALGAPRAGEARGATRDFGGARGHA